MLICLNTVAPQSADERETMERCIARLANGDAAAMEPLYSIANAAVLSKYSRAIKKLKANIMQTEGKAQLIRQITENNAAHTFEELAGLSVNELNLIGESGTKSITNVTSAGTASERAYIGESKAKQIALTHAGVSEGSIREYECELDREDGVMVYEIDFECGNYEYEYEINAITGEIVKYDIEQE